MPEGGRKPTPRPHQGAMIADVLAAFRGGATRAQLIAACGSGKTLAGAWVAQCLGARRVVLLAPSLLILRQSALAWRSVGLPPTVFVCGDVEVADGFRALVTTDPRAIVEHLGTGNPAVMFATYQSAEALHDAFAVHPADLLICDEAHRLAGWEGRTFSYALADENLHASRRLFLTATPRVVANRTHKAASWSMDDEAAFGTVAHRLTFGSAIAQGILCDWRLMAVQVQDPIGMGPTEREAAVHAAVLAAVGASDVRSGIVFRRTRELARASVTLVRKATAKAERGPTRAETALGDIPVADRLERAQVIADDGGLLSTSKALGDGVDIPAVDAVVFVDRKTAVIDIVQAVGRALRVDPRRPDKVATVVVPVVVDDSGVPITDGLEGMLAVLEALRSHDERLASVIDRMAAGAGTAKEAPNVLNDQSFLHAHGLMNLLDGPAGEAVLRDITDDVADRFEVGLLHLQRFAAEHGHGRPAQSQVVDWFGLGRWVNSRRQDERKGRMTSERRARLEAVPGWVWDPLESDWLDMFERVCAYAAANNGLRRLRRDGHIDMLQWTADQRHHHRRGTLMEGRARRLETIQGWSWSPPRGRGALTTEENVALAKASAARVSPVQRAEASRRQWQKRHARPDGGKMGYRSALDRRDDVDLSLLGTQPDTVLARMWGVKPTDVQYARAKRGIPRFAASTPTPR